MTGSVFETYLHTMKPFILSQSNQNWTKIRPCLK